MVKCTVTTSKASTSASEGLGVKKMIEKDAKKTPSCAVALHTISIAILVAVCVDCLADNEACLAALKQLTGINFKKLFDLDREYVHPMMVLEVQEELDSIIDDWTAGDDPQRFITVLMKLHAENEAQQAELAQCIAERGEACSDCGTSWSEEIAYYPSSVDSDSDPCMCESCMCWTCCTRMKAEGVRTCLCG